MAAHTSNPELHRALEGNLVWLRGLARQLVLDENDAEDLVQDTLAAALLRPPLLGRSIRPWLASVLRTLHVRARRGRGRRWSREEQSARQESLPGPDELLERLELAQQLVAAVRELPEPFRSAVLLRYREGLAPREIAQRMQVPHGTVRWRIHEGLARLRKQLDEETGSRAIWVGGLAPLAGSDGPSIGWGWRPILGAAGAVAGVLVAVMMVLSPIESHRVDGLAQPGPDGFGSESLTTAQLPLATGGKNSTRRVPDSSGVGPAAGISSHSMREPQDPVIRKQAVGHLVGRILGVGGLPAAKVEVTAYSALPIPIDAHSAGIGGRSVIATAWTDFAGAFRMEGLPTTPIQIHAEDGEGRMANSLPLRLSDNGIVDPLLLRLGQASDWQKAEEENSRNVEELVTVRLRGLVLHGAPPRSWVRVRQPIASDRVTYRDGFRVLWREAVLDAIGLDGSGRFELTFQVARAGGRVGIEFLDSEHRSLGVQILQVPARTTELEREFRVAALASLHASVVLDPLESISPSFLCLSNGDGRIEVRALGSGGEVRFNHLPAGEYQVRWTDHDGLPGHWIEFLTPPSRNLGERLRLRPGETRFLTLDRRGLRALRIEIVEVDVLGRAWCVQVTPPALPSGAPRPPTLAVPLDAGGRAFVRMETQGLHRVLLRPVGSESPLRMEWVSITGSDLARSVDLRFVPASGRWNGDPPTQRIWLRGEGVSAGVWVVEAFVDPDGALRIPEARPGNAVIVLAPDALAALAAQKIAGVELSANGSHDLSVP